MILYGLGMLVALAAGIGSLVCFIMVLIKMFQNDQQTLGIICIVLALCTGIGALIAFVYGWIKAGEWGLKNVMIAWTACILLAAIGYGVGIAGFLAGGGLEQMQEMQMQQMQQMQ